LSPLRLPVPPSRLEIGRLFHCTAAVTNFEYGFRRDASGQQNDCAVICT